MEREDFNKRILEIFVQCKLITEKDKGYLLGLQENNKSMPVADIAYVTNFISLKDHDAILIAQASERLAQVGEGRLEKNPLVNAEGEFNYTSPSFQRRWIDKERNPHLQSAQAIEHLATMLDGAVKINPELANNPQVVEAFKSAKVLAGNSYNLAANVFEKSDIRFFSNNYEQSAMDLAVAFKKSSFGDDLHNFSQGLSDGSNISISDAKTNLYNGLKAASASLSGINKLVFEGIFESRSSFLNTDISSFISQNVDKDLVDIKIPGEVYNKFRQNELEGLDFASKHVTPEMLKRNPDLAKHLVENFTTLVDLDNDALKNPSGNYSVTKEEFERLQIAANRVGLEMKVSNVKGDKGDKIDLLLNNELKASISVVFDNDEIGVKR